MPRRSQRAKEMLDIVKLGEFSGRRPNQLSGGQQQRVALARALVNMPSALLLDEPLAALDLKLREAMQLELKRIQREVGITFIFVTHDQHEALTMSDRIAVMSRGRVEQIGTPEEIYNRPASVFVAGFIGSANLLPGVGDRRRRASQLDAGARVDGAGDRRRSTGDAVTVMIRPERLHAPRPPVEGRSVSGTINDVIFEGSVDPTDRPPRRPHRDDGHGRRRRRPASRCAQGAPITLSWAPDAAVPARRAARRRRRHHHRRRRGAGRARRRERQRWRRRATIRRPSKFGRRPLLVGGGARRRGRRGRPACSRSRATAAATQRRHADGGTVGGGTLGTGDSRCASSTGRPTSTRREDGADRHGRPVQRRRPGSRSSTARTSTTTTSSTTREIEPYLGTGKSTNWDIMCPTNWMAARHEDARLGRAAARST